MTHRASGARVLVIRGRRPNLLLAPGRSRRILLRKDLRDRAMAIRAKARLRLLASQNRWHVITITSLYSLDRISLRGGDPRVMEHHSPNGQ